MAHPNWLQSGVRPKWVERSDWEFSLSDSDSQSDYDDDDDNSVEEINVPFPAKTSREMNLGGLVFNSTQFTANPVLEHSLNKLISNQDVAKISGDLLAVDKAKVKRTKTPKAPGQSPAALKKMLMSASAPSEIKRVTSATALEDLKSKAEVNSPSTYEYSTEMNLEDIMAMRNMIKEHGGQGKDRFAKTKSLSAPDLTSTTLFAGSKQMDELEEESESSDTESETEGGSAIPKSRRLVASDFSKTNPDEHLQSLVKDTFGVCPEKTPSSDVKEYFVAITPDMISSYDMEVATAIRNEDLRILSRMHRKGKTLQCCNRFGESIVHTVCRRGSTKLLRFLMERANVSMKVKCDYGRTPLHDACWTREPNFELIAIVVEECPDFLWMADKRGFTPLNYVQRDQWGMWCVFLEEHKLLLKPKAFA